MEILRKRSSTPIRLKSVGPGIVILLTTALARPQVDTLGIELHEEHVLAALVGVPIQGAVRVACHQGIAHGVHLHKDRQLSFAVLHKCAWKLKDKLREKPIRQIKMKLRSKMSPTIAHGNSMK